MPGDVLALVTPLQELQPGFYMLRRWMDRWATLQMVIDDEERETLTLTDRTATLPAELLVFFMPVGIRLEEWS